LTLCDSYRAFGKSGGNCLRCEVRASFTFLRFKISKASDRFAGHINTDILRCSICVADEGSDTPRVEHPIKITTGGFGSVGELVAGSLDLCAGVVGLLQTFCSFVRLVEQHGVTLWSSDALGDETEKDFAGIDGRVSESPAPDLGSDCSF
jgi:hypothetical protein